jgi:1,6-anhydro-N-acetylmuramate kinase
MTLGFPLKYDIASYRAGANIFAVLRVRISRTVTASARPFTAQIFGQKTQCAAGLADAMVTSRHAEAVEAFLATDSIDRATVDLIGFHGQTVLHRPGRRLTVKIGDGSRRKIRDKGHHDFRAADVAQGGQGAPLAPMLHRALAGAGLDRNYFLGTAVGSLATEDAAVTLTAFTAASDRGRAAAVAAAPLVRDRRPQQTLLRELADRLPCPVGLSETFGWSSDAMEAQAFAYLAARREKNLPIVSDDRGWSISRSKAGLSRSRGLRESLVRGANTRNALFLVDRTISSEADIGSLHDRRRFRCKNAALHPVNGLSPGEGS